jgi:hypothetical protein
LGEVSGVDFFSSCAVAFKCACADFPALAVGVAVQDDLTSLIAFALGFAEVELGSL